MGKMKSLNLSVLNEFGLSEFAEFNLDKDSRGEVNKLRMHKNYYPRNTPQDVDFEDDYFNSQQDYSASSVYEWNIDGLSEYQIMSIVHRMFMYASIVKDRGNSDKTVAELIVNGFTGSIKGWWDNVLSLPQRMEILAAVKSDNNVVREDAVYTLVHTILIHS